MEGYGSNQVIVTRNYGLEILGNLNGKVAEVWTPSGWRTGVVTKVGRGEVHPHVFSLARPTKAFRSTDRSKVNWTRRGGISNHVFCTKDIPWKLTDETMSYDLIGNQAVASIAPLPLITDPDYKRGYEIGKRVIWLARDPDKQDVAAELRDYPNYTPEFVLGAIQGLTKLRPRSDDPRRRALYSTRSDILEWVVSYSVLGGLIVTTYNPPHTRLEPANSNLGWKLDSVERGYESDIYIVKGVPSAVMALGGGLIGVSEVTSVY